jgi:hypothetical protein
MVLVTGACEHQPVHLAPQATAAAPAASQIGPAVLVVLAVTAIWWLATRSKGEIKLRLLAWLLLPIIVWLLIAANSPVEAARIASGAATGVTVAIGALGHLFAG